MSDLLGPVAHVALVVDDVRDAAAASTALGVTWCEITHPVARLRDSEGLVEEVTVDYVASCGGEPRVKLISSVAESFFVAGESAVHHVAYWVDDIGVATLGLCAEGWTVERTGLDDDDSVRYRYLRNPAGTRIELGRSGDRAGFDAWADVPGSSIRAL